MKRGDESYSSAIKVPLLKLKRNNNKKLAEIKGLLYNSIVVENYVKYVNEQVTQEYFLNSLELFKQSIK